MSSVVPRQGSAVGVAVEARQEAPELSQNRVATYSHDNVFARIQSRGANNGHVAGSQLREHSIASLEADMASLSDCSESSRVGSSQYPPQHYSIR
nr:hypothetical protein FVER53263_00795 [Fusarium verticillioides]